MSNDKYSPGQVVGILSNKKKKDGSSAYQNQALQDLFTSPAPTAVPVISNKNIHNAVSPAGLNQKKNKKTGKKRKHSELDKTTPGILTDSNIPTPDKHVHFKESDHDSTKTGTELPSKKQKTLMVVHHREKSLREADTGQKEKTKKKKKKKKKSSEKQDGRTLFVGNLPAHYTKKEITKLFKKYGDIETIRFRSAAPADPSLPKKVVVIKKEMHPERSNINAYVVFTKKEEAQKALKRNGKEIEGFHIRVDVAADSKKHDYKKSVFVGNLPFDIEEESLRKHFSDCGGVENVRIIRDSKTGLGKGFAYILFDSPDGVAIALNLDGQKCLERKLRIQRCVKKEKTTKTELADRHKDGSSQKKTHKFSKPSNIKAGRFPKKSGQKHNIQRNPTFARVRMQKKKNKHGKNKKTK